MLYCIFPNGYPILVEFMCIHAGMLIIENVFGAICFNCDFLPVIVLDNLGNYYDSIFSYVHL